MATEIKEKEKKKRRILPSDKFTALPVNFILDSIAIYEMADNFIPVIEKDDDRRRNRIEKKRKEIDQLLASKKQVNILNFLMLRSELTEDLNKLSRASRTFKNEILVMFLSRFDAFLIDLLKFYYENSKILEKSERKLMFSDLVEAGSTSFSDVKNRFIEEEIEQNRESRYKQLIFIQDVTKKKITSLEKLKPVIFESTERRNVIVHQRGYATNRYVAVLKKNNLPVKKKPGDSLILNRAYVKKIFLAYFELSLQTSVIVFDKLFEKEKEREHFITEIMNVIGLELERTGNWEFANEIFTQLEKVENLNPITEIYIKINKALCCKKLKLNKDKNKVIKALEKNKLEEIFKIAIYCLKNNYSSATDSILSIKDQSELEMVYYSLKTDIIFQQFINSKSFKENKKIQKLFEKMDK